jgi:hypothetical protein
MTRGTKELQILRIIRTPLTPLDHVMNHNNIRDFIVTTAFTFRITSNLNEAFPNSVPLCYFAILPSVSVCSSNPRFISTSSRTSLGSNTPVDVLATDFAGSQVFSTMFPEASIATESLSIVLRELKRSNIVVFSTSIALMVWSSNRGFHPLFSQPLIQYLAVAVRFERTAPFSGAES